MIWGILGGVLLSLLASELYDSCPRLTNLLLRSASCRLPAECRDRYWGEWMGELDSQGDLGKLRKLLWALWVFLCSWQMGRTLQSAVEQAKSLALEQSRKNPKRLSFREIIGRLVEFDVDGEEPSPPVGLERRAGAAIGGSPSEESRRRA